MIAIVFVLSYFSIGFGWSLLAYVNRKKWDSADAVSPITPHCLIIWPIVMFAVFVSHFAAPFFKKLNKILEEKLDDSSN